MMDQSKNFLIGLFVLAAMAIVIFIILFLNPSTGDDQKILRVRFADIDKITVGTRVNFAGKPVGEVVEIREIPGADHERQARDGVVYIYELVLKVDSGVSVYNTDQISLRTSGLLGERSVAITPMPLRRDEKLVNIDQNIIYAAETGSVEETLKEFKTIAVKLNSVLDGINRSLAKLEDSQVLENVALTAKNIKELTALINRPEEVERLFERMQIFTSNLVTVSQRANQSWGKVETILDNLDAFTVDTKSAFARINQGEGSLGRLLKGDEFYVKSDALLNKLDVLLNDVNHYGLLFHQDKGWQRLRARRMNLLFKLSNPQEFRNYFNDELDQISTSLSRVYMLLDKTEAADPCSDLLEQPEYNKVFGELLRRVSSIEESLRMYNEQLMDVKAMETELCEPCCNP